jgi:hypothetical protein
MAACGDSPANGGSNPPVPIDFTDTGSTSDASGFDDTTDERDTAVADDAGEDPLCQGVDCGPHGRCTVFNGGARCACEPGYFEFGLSCIPNSDPGPIEPALVANVSGGIYRIGAGETKTLFIALSHAPASPVEIPLVLSTTNFATLDASSLRFVPEDGISPKSVVVTGAEAIRLAR